MGGSEDLKKGREEAPRHVYGEDLRKFLTMCLHRTCNMHRDTHAYIVRAREMYVARSRKLGREIRGPKLREQLAVYVVQSRRSKVFAYDPVFWIAEFCTICCASLIIMAGMNKGVYPYEDSRKVLRSCGYSYWNDIGKFLIIQMARCNQNFNCLQITALRKRLAIPQPQLIDFPLFFTWKKRDSGIRITENSYTYPIIRANV